MMFVFEDEKGELFDSPESFILSLPHHIINWGTKLKIHPVYIKGGPSYYKYQTIQAMFYHEGDIGSLDFTYWVSDKSSSEDWYRSITNDDKIERITNGQIVRMDLGNDYPKYFKSKEDLAWYIANIYPLNIIHITDDISLNDI